MRPMPMPPRDAVRETARRPEPDSPQAGRRAARKLITLIQSDAPVEAMPAQADEIEDWFESVLAELDAEASATAAH